MDIFCVSVFNTQVTAGEPNGRPLHRAEGFHLQTLGIQGVQAAPLLPRTFGITLCALKIEPIWMYILCISLDIDLYIYICLMILYRCRWFGVVKAYQNIIPPNIGISVQSGGEGLSWRCGKGSILAAFKPWPSELSELCPELMPVDMSKTSKNCSCTSLAYGLPQLQSTKPSSQVDAPASLRSLKPNTSNTTRRSAVRTCGGVRCAMPRHLSQAFICDQIFLYISDSFV